jgi:hypothetical protein
MIDVCARILLAPRWQLRAVCVARRSLSRRLNECSMRFVFRSAKCAHHLTSWPRALVASAGLRPFRSRPWLSRPELSVIDVSMNTQQSDIGVLARTEPVHVETVGVHAPCVGDEVRLRS